MYKVIIFDFDYTLGDSTTGIVESSNYALRKMGIPEKSVDEIRKTIGLTLQNSYTALTGDKSEENMQKYTDYFVERANEIMTASTEMYEGAIEILKKLKAEGKRVGIVTTKYHFRIDAILDKFDLSDYVEIIVGGDDVKNKKPHPEALLLAVSQFGVDKSEVLYVGDSFIDAETAEGAKVDFAAVLTGTTSRDDFIKYSYVGIYDDVNAVVYH